MINELSGKFSVDSQPNKLTHRKASCVATENGWTSDDICESWFQKVFIPTALARRISDAPIVLLLDGHGSHISSRIRELAFQNQIFLFCLPPKTTHKAQPLDVAVFSLVQDAWKKICGESAKNGERISKATTIAHYMDAREAGLHSAAILDAWRRSGHYPINPSIFTDEDYAPSMIASTNTHLPPSFPIVDLPGRTHTDVTQDAALESTANSCAETAKGEAGVSKSVGSNKPGDTSTPSRRGADSEPSVPGKDPGVTLPSVGSASKTIIIF